MARLSPGADDGEVTDNSGIVRGLRPLPVLVAGLSVLLAGTTAAVVGFRDPADAATVVTSASRALVVLPSGEQHAAVVGERLPAGAVLRTAPQGGARLTASGRDVYVGAVSAVRVLDGVREALEQGQLLVDSRDGAPLRVDVDGGRVLVAQDSLLRVERAQVLRVGVYSGAAAVGAAGRQVTTRVTALNQVTQQYGALPAAPTALYLVKDAWEKRFAADLVSNDVQLERLHDGLQGADGTVVLASASTDLLDAATDTAATTDQGERALSIALAQVGGLSNPVGNLATVRTARTEGGSWGVVAAIVRARVNDVTGLLSASLDTPDQPAQAGGDPSLGPLVPGLSPTPAPTDDGTATRTPPTTRPPATRPPTPDPTPSASPGTVQQLIDTITKLLPTPPPTVAPPPLVKVPLPLVTPSVQLGPVTIG